VTKYYWDSCVFLAWIKRETCWPEDVTRGIEQVVEQWRAKQAVIVTSAITMLEVISSMMTKDHKDAFTKLFSDPYLQMIDVDRRIAGKASAIRSFYDTRAFKPDGSITGSVMSMGDAIHLATAVHFDVHEFQTLDGAGARKRRIDLLGLNGNVAGAKLCIQMPKYIPPPEPLTGPLQEMPQRQPGLFEDQEVSGALKPGASAVTDDARLLEVLDREVEAEADERQKASQPEAENAKPEPPVSSTESPSVAVPPRASSASQQSSGSNPAPAQPSASPQPARAQQPDSRAAADDARPSDPQSSAPSPPARGNAQHDPAGE
jgi:hypothetical protein